MSIHNSYAPGVPGLPVFPAPIIAHRAPADSDIDFPLAQVWLDTDTDTYYVPSSKSAGVATWIAADISGAVLTITGDTGGAIPPTAGNIDLLGTSNQITIAGSGSTLTASLVGPYTPATYTAHGVLVGAGTSSIVALSAASTGTVLAGVTGANPAFTGSPSVSGSLTAATTITATAGDITATLGNVVLNGAAKHLSIHGGAATDFIGTATLVNGVATVSNTNISTSDRVIVTRSAKNASTAYGTFEVVKTAATNFVITACKSDTTTETGDLSTVEYVIIRQV